MKTMTMTLLVMVIAGNLLAVRNAAGQVRTGDQEDRIVDIAVLKDGNRIFGGGRG